MHILFYFILFAQKLQCILAKEKVCSAGGSSHTCKLLLKLQFFELQPVGVHTVFFFS